MPVVMQRLPTYMPRVVSACPDYSLKLFEFRYDDDYIFIHASPGPFPLRRVRRPRVQVLSCGLLAVSLTGPFLHVDRGINPKPLPCACRPSIS